MIVIGAGGHSRSVIALLKNNGHQVTGIYDDSWKKEADEKIMGVSVVGKLNDLPAGESVCIAIGDSALREKTYRSFLENVHTETIKHTTAWIEKDVLLGQANLVFGNVFINAGVKIGNNNILNTACVVEHECEIGHHNHISVSAVLCGRVKVGNNCFIGAGAVIKDKISICDGVTVGAGSVVVRNITEPGIYAGNPSKRIK